MKVLRECENCKKAFEVYSSRIRSNPCRFCSKKCVIPWNAGLKTNQNVWNKGTKGAYSEAYLNKLREAKKGHTPWNKGLRGYTVAWNKGKICPQLSGQNHHNWKGGITPEVRRIRNSIQYKVWRAEVFSRDRFECQICGSIGSKLRANHIKKFSDYPSLRVDKSNGITICESCDLRFVFCHEEEWESYFNFNLETRGYKYE